MGGVARICDNRRRSGLDGLADDRALRIFVAVSSASAHAASISCVVGRGRLCAGSSSVSDEPCFAVFPSPSIAIDAASSFTVSFFHIVWHSSLQKACPAVWSRIFQFRPLSYVKHCAQTSFQYSRYTTLAAISAVSNKSVPFGMNCVA